ncbi:hypothetical protein V6N11_049302 [Hibiscus sabdariffa]|uniref:Adhesin domain-containing protein n=1 Tax=Hibiscus sabdariffa TaxID=183260 RepID=A0ABR2P018_9ROSI
MPDLDFVHMPQSLSGGVHGRDSYRLLLLVALGGQEPAVVARSGQGPGINKKFFHTGLVECMGFKGHEIKISAPADGIHVQRSSDIDISQSLIDTSDGRISIEQGNSHVTITSMSCGPDHGIK